MATTTLSEVLQQDDDESSAASQVDGIFFSFVSANGIRHRVASTKQKLDQPQGGAAKSRAQGHPLVLFLHGFPESWYSWRHQLLFFQQHPYLAVAPDMRGYGSTGKPLQVEAYTQPIVARDVVGIAAELGYDRFILVGHDFGSQLAWSISLLFPEKVIAVCGMSVPYAGTPKTGLLTMLQYKYGKCLGPGLTKKDLLTAKFQYILHHCLPNCAAEYDRNVAEFIYRLYATSSDGTDGVGEVEEGTPEFPINGLMFPSSLTDRIDLQSHDDHVVVDATRAPGLWKRLPRPKRLPPWLSKHDVRYFTQEFQRSGFHGPLCWYRALDLNVKLMADALRQKGAPDDKIRTPSLFMIGEKDSNILSLYGGNQKLVPRLKKSLPNLTREPIVLKDCGHWIQQEHPAFVNDALLRFFRDDLVLAQIGKRTSLMANTYHNRISKL